MLPGRPSKGVAALELSACGNSFEFGDRRPCRNIRWLEVMIVNHKDGGEGENRCIHTVKEYEDPNSNQSHPLFPLLHSLLPE